MSHFTCTIYHTLKKIILIQIIIHNNNSKNNQVNPCTDFLSDKDYLIHMIPHHQVAIDMCKLMIPITKSKTMQNIYRTIIFNQNIEILLMKQVLNDIPLLSGEFETSFRDTEFDTSLSMIINQYLKIIIVTHYSLNQMIIANICIT